MTNSKKDILIIMNNLRVGGAEKALISLLQAFDYSKYNIDLQLFIKEGLFLKQVPSQVTILEAPKEYKFFNSSFKKTVVECIKINRFDIIYNRIRTVLISRNEKIDTIKEQKCWKYIGNSISPLPKKYDLAIGFLEKTPNYFCVDKVTATNKIGFVNNDYEKLKMEPSIDIPYFDKLNYIATVSEECLLALKRSFPNHIEKLIIIGNISSPKLINQLAQEEIEPLYLGLKLITLGRLSPQKGYDLLIESANILKKHQIDFKWYILGVGELQDQLNQMIANYQLQDQIIFLGLKENPYPYIKQADIYVQPSRFEGKSVAIDEAKILQKPIIVTNFSTAKDQITNGVNGLIVEMNPEAVANAIINLENNEDLQKKLVFNLSTEIVGNEDEIKKIYKIINS